MNSSQNRLFAKLLTAAIIAISVLGISLSHAQMRDMGDHGQGVRWSAGNIPSFEEQQKMEQFYRERVYPHQQSLRQQYEEAERRLYEDAERRLKSSELSLENAERELRSKSEELDRRLAELELMRSELFDDRQVDAEARSKNEELARKLAEIELMHRRLAKTEEYRLAAEQGDAEAQYNLFLQYADGDGVPQDYSEAVKWTRKAAEQGYANAQYSLGEAYRDGLGVQQDLVNSYKWILIANASGHEGAKIAKKSFKEFLKRKQIAEAQKLSREWKPRGQ